MREFSHQPVLLREVVEGLRPQGGGLILDGTVGGAGHATALLEAGAPRLIGLDRDEVALAAAQRRLQPLAGRFELFRANYSEMADYTPAGSCHGVLLDLGLSSPQLDWPERGFSFQAEGPLDMRMDVRDEITAAVIVNSWPEAELARLFWELGEERASRRIARWLVQRRVVRPFSHTLDLAETVAQASGVPRGRYKVHPATRVFQALRLEVNRELEALDEGLRAAWTVLQPAGRLAVISFHSLEDRRVKEFGRALERDYRPGDPQDSPELRQPKAREAHWVWRKPLSPTEEEIRANPRSRSAKLRVLEKLAEPHPGQNR